MKIKPNIKKQRIADIHHLYELITEDNDDYKEELYNILKETLEDDKIIDSIYSHLENILSLTLKETKKIYKSFDKDKIIDLEDLLYDKDGKSLDERVKQWLEKYSDKKQLMTLFYYLCLIVDTESFRIISTIVKEKTNCEYVEIISDSCDDCSGGCSEWADGEPHHEDDVELPPYHPNCHCEAVFFEKEEVLEDL